MIQEIDLQSRDFDDGDERHIVSVAPPHQGERARHQLLGRERNDDDVVHSSVECRELGPEVATPAQSDRRDPLIRDPLSDEVERIGVMGIEIHQHEVRPPAVELGVRNLRSFGDPSQVFAVIQGERNEVRERLVDDDQHPGRSEEPVLPDPGSIRAG